MERNEEGLERRWMIIKRMKGEGWKRKSVRDVKGREGRDREKEGGGRRGIMMRQEGGKKKRRVIDG